MRLKKEQIERVSHSIVERLEHDDLASFDASKKEVLSAVTAAISHNFHQEEQIDKQAEAMLDQYGRNIESGQVDGRKLFHMIKKQLAKDKGFVI